MPLQEIIEGIDEMLPNADGAVITRIAPKNGYELSIVWGSGKEVIKDLEPIVLSNKNFKSIRDLDLFKTARPSDDGANICWVDGSSVSASVVDKLPCLSMTKRELRIIMTNLKLTSSALGSLLGISRRAVTNYRCGRPIPKSVVLAIRYLEARLL